MFLYVLRHGKAGDGYPDELRELTERGRENVGAALTRRAQYIETLDQIQASPLVRAQQTAEIVSNILRHEKPIVTNESLVPWASQTDFLNGLNDDLNAILVASHQPFVSELVELVCGERVAMPTSALAAIKMAYPAEGGGKLLWLDSG